MRRVMAIVSAFALLMGLAGMSTAATASTYEWQGNGYPNASCDAESTTALWIWTGDTPLSLTINGHEQTGSWTQMGNGSWHWTVTIDGGNFPPTTASITYTGEAGTLTLSGCDEGGAQPTPTPTATPLPEVTPTPAPVVTPTPSGTVAPAMGTPSVTPPATDTLGSVQPAPSNDGLRIVLIGLASLLIAVLAFTVPRRSSRRR